MLYNKKWDPQLSTLGEQAQKTRDAWDMRIFSTMGIVMPALFAEHRKVVMKRIERSTINDLVVTFDDLALEALKHSLGIAERLGSKEMPDDPARMTKDVGNAYDSYLAEGTLDYSTDKVKLGYTEGSIPLLNELAGVFNMPRSAVAAIAGEYYGHSLLEQLVVRETAF